MSCLSVFGFFLLFLFFFLSFLLSPSPAFEDSNGPVLPSHLKAGVVRFASRRKDLRIGMSLTPIRIDKKSCS